MSSVEVESREQLLAQARAELDRRRRGASIADEADELSSSLYSFIRHAWTIVEPRAQFVEGWHLQAISEHLEAVTAGELRRLQIWVPPGSMKSLTCSIFWPAWEWTRSPGVRYITGSYSLDLAVDFAIRARDLIRSSWYQARWGDVFQMRRDHDLKQSYANDRGGQRFVTSPTAGATGRHGDRILIDDPVKADDADVLSKISPANDWYDSTLSTRAADPKSYAEVIIMQRLARGDLAEHVLAFEDWTVLCLPERFEERHPFRSPAKRTLPSGRELRGDLRHEDGELLWPARIGELENQVRAAKLSQHRSAGQLQQRPAAREGAIIRRALWRYFDPRLLDDDRIRELPAFRSILYSWDTTFKEKTSSDYVAGGAWGIIGGDRYLLRTIHAQMSLSTTKASIAELRDWGIRRWPNAGHRVLVENTANGPEIIAQLKREIPGVIATKPSVAADQPAVKKTVRAEACEPDFEAGNVFVPGAPSATLDGYDGARTPAWVQAVIEQTAEFPSGAHDDLVDMTTQALNYARANPGGQARVSNLTNRRLVIPGVQ